MQILLTGPSLQIRIKINARPGSRTGRFLALQFYREIKPVLHFLRAEIFDDRPISLRQTVDLSKPSGPYGAAVRLRRQLAGLTQAQLATKIGISRRHLNRIERGHVIPHPGIEARLSLEFPSPPSVLPGQNPYPDLTRPKIPLDAEAADRRTSRPRHR